LRDWRLGDGRRRSSIRFRRLQDGLLLMSGAFAEHAVQAKPNEQGDQGKDDNDGQISILYVFDRNIVRLS
jgi:hypothetical protein